ncbi:6499_t:CDS:1, partial [Dentiscutata erythropus]
DEICLESYKFRYSNLVHLILNHELFDFGLFYTSIKRNFDENLVNWLIGHVDIGAMRSRSESYVIKKSILRPGIVVLAL